MEKENLNEEIERIKSLFSEERLYGNLVTEACDDVDEAINFLSSQGYIIKKETESDFCIGNVGPLNKPYNYLKNNYKRVFGGGSRFTCQCRRIRGRCTGPDQLPGPLDGPIGDADLRPC